MKKTELQRYNNEYFNPGGNLFTRLVWYFINALFFLNPLNPCSRIKVLLLRIFGARIGKGVIIKPSVNIKYPWNLEVGDYTWIGENVWIDNLAKVSIGSNACISQGALLLCGNHDYKINTFNLIVKPITLEDGVWVGAKSIVCPGVIMHSHCVLTVGSVATSDMNRYTIYQGNPAKIIRDRIIN